MSEAVQTQVEENAQIEGAVEAVVETPKTPEELAKIQELKDQQRAMVEAALMGYTPEQALAAFRNKTLDALAGTVYISASDERKDYANLVKSPESEAALIAVPLKDGTPGAGYMAFPNPNANLKKAKARVALVNKAGYESTDISNIKKPAILSIAGNGNIFTVEKANVN